MDDHFVKFTLSDQEGDIRVNIRFVSHYRPFVDDGHVIGTIIDFASGDSHLVREHPEEVDQRLTATRKDEFPSLN